MAETMTSSPSFINRSANDDATKFRLSVVPRVNITSPVSPAFMNRRTRSRAASWRSVACCER